MGTAKGRKTLMWQMGRASQVKPGSMLNGYQNVLFKGVKPESVKPKKPLPKSKSVLKRK